MDRSIKADLLVKFKFWMMSLQLLGVFRIRLNTGGSLHYQSDIFSQAHFVGSPWAEIIISEKDDEI